MTLLYPFYVVEREAADADVHGVSLPVFRVVASFHADESRTSCHGPREPIVGDRFAMMRFGDCAPGKRLSLHTTTCIVARLEPE
jgi:hypothetical protein